MGKPAARIGNSPMAARFTVAWAPCPTVLIGGKPAWRIGDQHTCPIPNGPPPACSGTPHGPGLTTARARRRFRNLPDWWQTGSSCW